MQSYPLMGDPPTLSCDSFMALNSIAGWASVLTVPGKMATAIHKDHKEVRKLG